MYGGVAHSFFTSVGWLSECCYDYPLSVSVLVVSSAFFFRDCATPPNVHPSRCINAGNSTAGNKHWGHKAWAVRLCFVFLLHGYTYQSYEYTITNFEQVNRTMNIQGCMCSSCACTHCVVLLRPHPQGERVWCHKPKSLISFPDPTHKGRVYGVNPWDRGSADVL